MGSITGLKTGNFTSINNSGQIRLGAQINPGTAGQALVSSGPDDPATWGTHTGVIQPLTMGTDLSLASGSATFDGSVADTINAAGHGFGSGGNGIDITGTTITTDNDGTTINNTGGTGAQNQVLKVPNALTSGTNVSFSSGTTYDGSAAITINSTDTDTTYQGSTTIDIDTTTNPDTINCLKVPNALTAGTNVTFSSGTTYDGSAAITINATDTDTTYTGGNGIDITGTTITTDNDGTTINNTGGTGAQNQVLKVPNSLTAGTNISFSSGTTYDGSAAITINSTGGTTYTAGTNLNLAGTTFNLDTSISGMINISFLTDGTATSITGSNYPNTRTTCTYLDLSSSTNIIPGGVLATKVQETAYFKSFGSSYGEYSTDFRTSFVANSANIMVEFRGVVRADNKIFYGGLYDYNAGSYQANTRNRFNYNDESDQDMTTMTWWMSGLTPGNTYYISPYFRGNSATVYIYAGHSGATDGFAPAIMRIYDGGNDVNIY